MITLTVITCTFNAAGLIERTLESVKSQDYPHVEHLLIDGKSKDSTCDIIKRYMADEEVTGSQHEINFISEPDKGLYDAMNKGLNLAKGDYLVYLNAGDTFPDSKTLSAIAESVGEPDLLPGVIYGDTDVVDESGHFVRHRRLSPPEQLSWRDFRNGMLVCHQAFYALSNLARAIPYNNKYRFSADVDWCIRVMKASEQEGRALHNVHRVVANFLEGGMSTTNHRSSLKERFEVMRTHYGLIPTIVQHLWFVVRSVLKR